MLECMDHDEDAKEWKYLNPFCKKECLTILQDGNLQCNCGDTGIYEWKWHPEMDSCISISKNHTEFVFHPVYSSGTAVLRGSQPFKKNYHHYWEVKMMSNLYGTDVMVGVGTSKIILSDWKFRFCSLLGYDGESWGYSYTGKIQHNKVRRNYGTKFGRGSLIGVHLDMCSGKLEFYLNRKPLGLAFEGLKNLELYPMVSSTAAQSVIKMTCSISVPNSLEMDCLKIVIKNPKLLHKFKNIPGLVRLYENYYFWLIPLTHEEEDPKRKRELENFMEFKKKFRKNNHLQNIHNRARLYPHISLHFLLPECKKCDNLDAGKDGDDDEENIK